MKLNVLPKAFIFVIYVSGIVLVSYLSIAIASGYRYNFYTNRVYKVSVVHLISDPVSNIEINGQDVNTKTPKAIYLEPGSYNIALKQEGYTPLNLIVSLGSGSLYEKKDLTLFKSEINPEIRDNNNPNLSSFTDESLSNTKSDLFIGYNHEIWVNHKLVTRLSSNILSAAFYSNQSYILYQTDSYVGIIRTDGTANRRLFDYSSPYALRFEIKNRGQALEAKNIKNIITATIN